MQAIATLADPTFLDLAALLLQHGRGNRSIKSGIKMLRSKVCALFALESARCPTDGCPQDAPTQAKAEVAPGKQAPRHTQPRREWSQQPATAEPARNARERGGSAVLENNKLKRYDARLNRRLDAEARLKRYDARLSRRLDAKVWVKQQKILGQPRRPKARCTAASQAPNLRRSKALKELHNESGGQPCLAASGH